MSASRRARPASHPLRVFAAPIAAFALIAAIMAALVFAVIPAIDRPHPAATSTPDVVLAAANIEQPAENSPTATARANARPTRNIKLDLGPIVTVPPVLPSPTPTVAPTATRRPTSGPELVVNGDFETADSSWYVEQGAGIAIGAAHSGAGFLALDAPAGYADQRVTVETGVRYRVSLWTNAAVAGGEIGIRYEDDRLGAVAAGQTLDIPVTDGTWTRIAFAFVPPAGAQRAVISFWNPNGGAIEIDNVSIRADLSSG